MSDYTAGDDSLDLRAIAPITPDAWAYAEGWLDDTEVIQEARHLADDVGLIPVSHGTASLLTLLTRLLGASAVVEVGTGTGVSGAALLQGMTADGVLTSIDLEGEHQRAAREAFAVLGDLVRQLPCFRLHTGSDPASIPPLIAGWLERHR